jgi:hypothetical protein
MTECQGEGGVGVSGGTYPISVRGLVMFVYEAVHKLKEEARKSWEYSACNKIVQLGEFVDSQGDARFPVSGSSEDYVGSRVWFEFFL